MSPIIGISDDRRLPRLGKIHLGVKVEEPNKKPYPRATDYFVCPPEVIAVHGDKPKDLPIMFPVDREEEFAQQWYRCYSNKWGLICKGDGASADRTFDRETGELAGKDTEETERHEIHCPGPQCPQILKRQCRPIMNLQFILPQVPGIGVYQLDTGSRRSIRNVNTALEMIRSGCGRVAYLHLVLSLRPEEVQIEGGPKHAVYVLLLTASKTMPELVGDARKSFPHVLLPMPTPPSEEEPPEDLIPAEVIEQAEADTPAADAAPAGPQAAKSQAGGPAAQAGPPGALGPAPTGEKPRKAGLPGKETPDDITAEDIPDFNTLLRLCWQFWAMQPTDVVKALGYSNQMEAMASGIKLWDAWLTIKASKN